MNKKNNKVLQETLEIKYGEDPTLRSQEIKEVSLVRVENLIWFILAL